MTYATVAGALGAHSQARRGYTWRARARRAASALRGLGQMGGQWRWFDVWGNPGQSWGSRGRFLGWVYMDYGTAQFLVRRGRGVTPNYRQHQYGAKHIFKPVFGAFKPEWQEIHRVNPVAPGGGVCTDQTGCLFEPAGHVSWAYPTTEKAMDAVRDMAAGPDMTLPPGTASSEDWVKHIVVGDGTGRQVN